MCTSALWLICVSLLLSPSLSCFQCFVELSDSARLCRGHILTEHNIRNVDACFRMLDRIFNNNARVIEAGRVGKGYDKQLKEILDLEILPMAEEFDRKEHKDTVYEERLQTAADNFISAASKLPRVSGCFPPCGFQSEGREYNCVTCKYDLCEFPLDCPVKDVKVLEYRESQVRCEVPFSLPDDIEVIWRFAEEVKTQLVDQFKEMTAGEDTLYSIPSTRLHHQGTYQCEIYSGQRSIVRLYFYLTVTPQAVEGHTDLQEIFDLSLLPGGRLLPQPGGPAHPPHLPPSPLLLTTYLASVLLLLILSLGVLHLVEVTEESCQDEQADEDGDLGIAS
ncbi:sperm acrosome membrane-associated protein 6 isoform X1 [Xyrichtys novacula]|uniref:Sperm acrosome membrane-associated protein 6 isoform X1 n=1 Tax=Xyrichtys novacula TaxID=13765 RepID=A0AAV1FLY0_XYRNO|nr:sperm acrosome membrane-associated protein 6 isoform X1 [Xyrichtys novacula]